MKEVGRRMKKLRDEAGISQAKFAEIMDSSQSAVNRYEHGLSTPSVEYFRKFADYFDVSLDYLFARTDKPQGRDYEFRPRLSANGEEIRDFIEMCFDPKSAMNGRLKEMLFEMMQEGGK